MARLDPSTGLDLDDPEVQAMLAQQQRDRAALTHAPAAGPPVAPAAAQIQTQLAPTAPGAFDVPPPPPAPPPVRSTPSGLRSLDDAVAGSAGPLPDLPPDIKTSSEWKQGESYVKPTAGFNQARKDLGAATDQEVAAGEKTGQAKVKTAQATADSAKDVADAVRTANAAAATQRKQQQDLYQAGKAELDAQRQKVIKDGGRSYYDDQGAGSIIASALLSGVGQWAATMSGGPNQALNVINQQMDRDAALKRQKAQMELERLGLKGADLKERLDMATLEIQNAKSAQLENLIAERDHRLAKAGVGAAEAEKDAIKAGLLKQKAATDLQIEQGLNHHVERSSGGSTVTDTGNAAKATLAQLAGRQDKPVTGKETTDNERAKDNFLTRAYAEAQRLKGMDGYSDAALKEVERWRRQVGEIKDTDPSKFLNAVSSVNGDVLKRLQKVDPKAASRFTTEMAWATNVLRPDSGAAINAGEYVTKVASIQKMKGDTPDILRQKNERLVDEMAGVATQSFRPRYWGEQLHGLIGDAKKLAPMDIAKLNMALKAASPEEAAQIRSVLAGAR